MIVIKSPAELSLMRRAGRVVADVLAALREMIEPGLTTRELNKAAEKMIEQAGGVPAFKGYHGFPASICVSVNDEVVHGIPGPKRLEEGDIVSVDVGVIYQGFHGDAARTFPVGRVSREAVRLLRAASESLEKGIAAMRPGNRLGDVSHAIEAHVRSYGYSVVRDFVGHGIGREMHESPQVPNFGAAGRGPRLKPGMTLALEPMVNTGGHEVKIGPDGWTVSTADGSLSAHFEDTVAVTDGEPEPLTRER